LTNDGRQIFTIYNSLELGICDKFKARQKFQKQQQQQQQQGILLFMTLKTRHSWSSLNIIDTVFS
jgi:hypothetical protein